MACLSRGQSLSNKLFGRKREVVAVRHYRIPGGARDTPLSVQILQFSCSFRQTFCETRLHSRRMGTACAFTVSPSMLGGGGLLWGVSGLGGVCSQGRVCLLWVCLLRGCVCRSSTCTHVIHTSSAALLMVSVDLNYLSTLTGSGYWMEFVTRMLSRFISGSYKWFVR